MRNTIKWLSLIFILVISLFLNSSSVVYSAWNANRPLASDLFNASDTYIRNNFLAIEAGNANIAGTQNSTFWLDSDNTGPILYNNANTCEIRNYANSASGNLRAATGTFTTLTSSSATITNGTFTNSTATTANATNINAFETANAANMRALGFGTASGTAEDTASGVAATLFAVPGYGRYEIYATVLGTSATYTAYATVVACDATGMRIVSSDGAGLTITLSGTNVQATQISGTTGPDIFWQYLRIQ